MSESDKGDGEGIAPDEPAPEPTPPAARPARPVGRLVRIGCVLLGIVGLLSIFAGVQTAPDPAKARCNEARFVLEDEDEVEDADDVPCEEAISRAIALGEDDDDVRVVNSESFHRTRGIVWLVVGALSVIGAMLTMRTATKRARLVALVAAGLGLVSSPLGFFGIPILGFVVYAIFFSADARAVFGEPSGPRMFRPRQP